MKAEADQDDQAGTANTGRNPGTAATCAEVDVATRTRTKAEAATTSLMEAVVERRNLWLAYQRVVENKELERRGPAFCRYADDCNIYVASERAGVRLLTMLTACCAHGSSSR